MKILVPIKRVIDAYVKIRVKRDETGVETQNVKMSMNPFCEIAMEQAVRLKESGDAQEVIVVTIGPQSSQDVLRTALAMGADRAIHIRQDEGDIQPLAVARLLKGVVEQEEPGLVLMGKQAIDGDHNQTGQMLAAMLEWPQGTFISKLELSDDQIQITREIDGGLQTLKLSKPAILTVDLRLNEPRYPSLPNIMKAKKKPIEEKTAEDFGVDTSPRYEILKVTEPPEREAGVKVESVSELVEKLKNEAKVI